MRPFHRISSFGIREFPLIALVLAAPFPGVRADDDKTALAKKAQAILKTNCYRCHG